MRGEIFKTHEARLFLQNHVDIGYGMGYGYGWLHDRHGRIRHDGATAGYVSFISVDFARGLYHIILTNQGFANVHQYGASAGLLKGWSESIWQWRDGDELNYLPAVSHEKVNIQAELMADTPLSITAVGNEYQIQWQGSPHLFDLFSHTPIEPNSSRASTLIEIAHNLRHGNYWSMASHFDWEMKLVT